MVVINKLWQIRKTDQQTRMNNIWGIFSGLYLQAARILVCYASVAVLRHTFSYLVFFFLIIWEEFDTLHKSVSQCSWNRLAQPVTLESISMGNNDPIIKKGNKTYLLLGASQLSACLFFSFLSSFFVKALR